MRDASGEMRVIWGVVLSSWCLVVGAVAEFVKNFDLCVVRADFVPLGDRALRLGHGIRAVATPVANQAGRAREGSAAGHYATCRSVCGQQ